MRRIFASEAHRCDGWLRKGGLLCLLCLIVGLGVTFGQSPEAESEEEAVVWAGQAGLGSSPSRRAVVERPDGSILISGNANFKGTQGFFLLALSRRGEALWQRLIGGSPLLHEALGMRSLSDGSTLVLARVIDRSSRGGRSPWLAKISQDGTLLWERRIVGDRVGSVWGFDAYPDGSTVMAGWLERPEAWVVKINPGGAVMWGQRFVRSGVRIQPHHVECTRDGGVVLTGALDRDVWVAKLDSGGDLEWSIRAGNPDPSDIGWGTAQTEDGGYLVVGETESMGADGVLWVLKLDGSGRPQWQGGLGGPGSDVPRSVAPDAEGGVWVLGLLGSRGQTKEAYPPWVVHVGPDGTILAEILVTEPGPQEPPIKEWEGIAATRDGGAVVTMLRSDRRSRWKLRVLRLDSTGRTARNYPWIESPESSLLRGALTVRPAPLESGRLNVEAIEVQSDQVEIPLEHRTGWETDAPPGPPYPRKTPVPRSLRPLAGGDSNTLADVSTSQLLIDGRFKAIERRAEELIRTKEKNENGRWKLTVFYGDLGLENELLLAYGLDRTVAQLELWQKTRPKSITARIALANAYMDVAWENRGAGLGREVTSEAWATVRENLHLASEMLAPIYVDRPTDPMYWAVLFTLANIGGTTPASADQILETGLEIAPDFIHLYVTQTVFLLPQWGGGRGEIERFAAEMSDRRAATLGEELYARIARQLFFSERDASVFSEHGMKWPRVRSGMDLIRERYPSRWNLHMSIRLACLAEDREEAHRLLTLEGAEYGDDVAGVWRSARRYDEHRRWAMRQPAGDWASLPYSEWPPLAMAIEAGDDPWPDGDARVGFLVNRPDGAQLLVTAVDLPVREQRNPEATLEILSLPRRLARWSVVPRGKNSLPVSGFQAVGLRVPPRTTIDPRVLLAKLPDGASDLGVPALPVVMGEELKQVWVVGCATGRPGCVQQLVSGRVSGQGWDTDSASMWVTVDVDERGFEASRLGSPVIDELGRVLAVVVNRSQDSGSEYQPPNFKVQGLVVGKVIQLAAAEGPYIAPSRSEVNEEAVYRTALKLLEEGRWGELGWLAEGTRDLRTDDGRWLGMGLLRASRNQTFKPQQAPERRPFDAVGAALVEWAEKQPAYAVAIVLATAHIAEKGPEIAEGAVPTWDEWKEIQKKWCEDSVVPMDAMVEEFHDEIFAHVSAVRQAAACGNFDRVLTALAGLATVAPDLTPVFESALTTSSRQVTWTNEEFGEAIDRAAALGGPEVQSSLYGLMMRRKLKHDQEPDPSIDLDRVAANLEKWIDRYPGGMFDEAGLLNVLCIKGDVEKAAARLDITHCREISMSGTVWNKEICRACFGSDLIPKPRESFSDSRPTSPRTERAQPD